MTASRLPSWLKRRIPKGNANHFTGRLLKDLQLATVCEHAKCPNQMECYARKTATFLLLGDICTRNCSFCAVQTGIPREADSTEPQRIVQAVRTLELKHVVLTCVSRDDLEDGGANHFCLCIDALRNELAEPPTIEVLPSDFAGRFESVDQLADREPDVYNYNTETVPRLFPAIRGPIPHYARTLEMFRRIRTRRPNIRLKSGLMLGLGETDQEIISVLKDLRQAGCHAITLGQYLQPAPDRLPVQRYVTPEEFDHLGQIARDLGFESVASAPFVRSSYRAEMIKCTKTSDKSCRE